MILDLFRRAFIYQILVSLNPLKAYRHVFQWLYCDISVYYERADDGKELAWLKLRDFARYVIKDPALGPTCSVVNSKIENYFCKHTF